MQTRFYVSHNGLDHGPFSVDQIRQKVKAGELLPFDYMFVEAKDDWIPLQDFIDFKSEAPAPPPTSDIDSGDVTSPQFAAPTLENSPYPNLPPSPSQMVSLQQPHEEDEAPPELSTEDEFSDEDFDGMTFGHGAHAKADENDETDTFYLGAQEELEGMTDPYLHHGLDEGTDPSIQMDDELTQPVYSSTKPNLKAVHNKPQPGTIPPVSPKEHQPPPAAEVQTPKSAEIPLETKTAPPKLKRTPNTVKQIDTDEFVGGRATLKLSLQKAEHITLTLSDNHNTGLEIPTEAKVRVKAATGTTVSLHAPEQCRAGEAVHIHLEVHDTYGNLDENYSGKLGLFLSGDAKSEHSEINIQHGIASFDVQNTKAEQFTLELKDHHGLNLKLPDALSIECKAGPAKQVVLDTPPEAVAGEPVQVQLKVVDAYGNVATDFKGKLSLNINGATYTAKAS